MDKIIKLALEAKVGLFVKNGKLGYRASKEGISDEFKSLLIENKQALTDYLTAKIGPASGTNTQFNIEKSQCSDVNLASYAQQRLWFVDKLDGSTQYNQVNPLRLKGELDSKALNSALKKLILRNQVLRTIFIENQGNLETCLLDAEPFCLNHFDIVHLPVNEQESFVSNIVAEQGKTAFNLSEDLMLRAELVSLDVREHVLLIVTHHIAFDGWSLGLFTRELSALYNSEKHHQTIQLPEPEIQYSDYAAWQRNWITGEGPKKQLSYWKKYLSGIPDVHSLPLDAARPSKQTFKGGKVTQQLSPTLSKMVLDICKAEDATLFMLMHSAFSVLLGRYSNETDIVIGIPIAGRSQRQVEPLIGFFINSLILRSDLSGNPTFSTLLKTNIKQILQGFENQHLPIEMLIEALKPNRDPSYSPLFQIMLAVQNNDHGKLELDEISIEPLPNSSSSCLFDLELIVMEEADSILLSWNYSSALFQQNTIARMANCFEILLEGIVASPSTTIQSLPLLPDEELNRLENDFNQSVDYGVTEQFILQLIEQQTRLNSDRIAVICEDQKLTYSELHKRSNQIAHLLINKGAKPDTLIGVYMERSIDLMVAILGILKSGAAFVAMDSNNPVARNQYIIEDAQLTLLLTQKSLSVHLQIGAKKTIVVDEPCLMETLSDFSAENITPKSIGLTSSHLAYVIYTSGTTGTPKGVMVEHRGLANMAMQYLQRCELTAQSRVGQFYPAAFDASISEWAMALCSGAELHIIPSDATKSPQELGDLVENNGISHITIPPAMLSHLDIRQFNSVTHLLVGGEACPLESAIKWQEGRKFYNAYGPSEASICASICQFEAPFTSLNLGFPIDNVELHVVDENMQLVPQGVIGELVIGGVSLARGYLNKPALTAEKFVKVAFFGRDPSRYYKTGDLAKRVKDGNLEYVTRKDHQVKLRGMRIELGEIEHLLAQQKQLSGAIVSLVDSNDEKRLVAYLETAMSSPAQKTELVATIRSELQAKLPAYMIPAAFVLMEQFPATTNGKVDLESLPMPAKAEFSYNTYVAAQNRTEVMLCDIWQEILELDKVSVEANFFELGGHSLLASNIVSKISDKLDIELSIRTFFDNPTVRSLARYIADSERTLDASTIVPLDHNNPAPLSFAQQRLWFVDNLQGSLHYNQTSILSIIGQLDVSGLRKALESIVNRHEILRTNVIETDNSHVQVVKPRQSFDLKLRSLLNIKPDVQSVEIENYASKACALPFDLKEDLLLRAELLELSPENHVLILSTHHIAFDGVSLGILSQELTVFYDSYLTGQECPLPTLPVQYGDFASWQRNWLQGEVLQQKLAFWEGYLADIPPVHRLPLDFHRPSQQTFDGLVVTHKLDHQVAQQIQDFCKAQNVTLFMFLQTAFSVLLGRYSGESDVVMGTPIAGRNNAQIQGLIGLFLNNLVLRTQLEGNPRFTDLLGINKEQILDAYDHQDIPFEMLVDKLKPERSHNHSPIFQVVFAVQNFKQHDIQLSGLNVEPYGHNSDRVMVEYDLGLHVMESTSDLTLQWSYNSALFKHTTIEAFADSFDALISGIIDAPERNIHALPVLTDDMRKILLNQWNNTERSYPDQICIHQEIEKQVLKTPDFPAVVFESNTLTYKEMNQQANQIAHYLIAQGVAPGTLIGLCLERSEQMILGILGILKAGGAYVPIEPNYPEDRIDYILRDSNIEIVLTDKELMGELPLDDLTVLPIDAEMRRLLLSSYSTENPDYADIEHSSEQLAYVIYTSGTTGKPKGVEIAHRNVLHLAEAQKERFDVLSQTRALQFASIVFDASVFELFVSLFCGHTVYVCSDEQRKDPKALEALVSKYQIELATLPPAILKHIDAEAFASLNVLIMAGESPTEELMQRFARHSTVFNAYGPTEVTVCASAHKFTSGNKVQNIGSPLTNTLAYVLDEFQQLAPIGAFGELCVGGKGLAKGYLNKTALTKEKFIEKPLPGVSRLYRTGDMVRWLDGGELEFLGRSDHQVKIRGYRIELAEIEHELRNYKGVKEPLVLARENPNTDGKQLIAYIVPDASVERQEHNALINQIKLQLRGALPDYMQPSTIMLIEQIPLTLNGKVDLKNLPEPEMHVQDTLSFEAPRNELEKVLCEIWGEVLGREKVGISDNFFSIGGDSILSINVVSKANNAGLNLSVKDIFKHQTIACLVENLESLDSGEASIDNIAAFSLLTAEEVASLPDSYQQTYEDIYPMSELQVGMVFHTELDESGTTYKGILSYKVVQQWNETSFREALAFMLEQHPVLRTHYDLNRSRPLQFVAQQVGLPLQVGDLRHQSEDEQKQILTDWMREQNAMPFDWFGPLFKIYIYRLTDDSFEFGVRHHHAVYDGWSDSIFISQLFIHYKNLMDGKALPNVQKDFAFRDFIALEQQALSSTEAKGYWAAQLQNIPHVQIPQKQQRTLNEHYRASETLRINELSAIAGPLISLAKELGVPLQSVLLAAHSKVLSMLSGHTQTISSVVANGRPEKAGGDKGIGLFLNSLPVCIDVAEHSWLDLIRSVSDIISEGLEFRHYPASAIQRETGRSYSEVLFNYTHFHVFQDMLDQTGMGIEGTQGTEQNNYDFAVNFSRAVGKDDIAFSITFNLDKYDRSLIERIAGYYVNALNAILQDIQLCHNHSSLLSDAEQKALLNFTQTDSNTTACSHHLFEEQVEVMPKKVAVRDLKTTLTYAELNTQANRLAHYLIQHAADVPLIGVCMARSVDTIVAILAVLKAGRGYVPIDPGYPSSRIDFIIEDSKLDLIICDESSRLSCEAGSVLAICLADSEFVTRLKTMPDHNLSLDFGLINTKNLSHVIYTSGSTGLPKGVCIEHNSVCALIGWLKKVYSEQERQVVLASTSICFDLSVFEIWSALASGGELLVVDNLLTLIEQKQCQPTLINTVPSALQSLLESNGLPQSVAVINLAGEPLKQTLVNQALAKESVNRVFNLYGPSEDTTYTTYREYDAQIDTKPSIGKAIDNTYLVILNERQELVPTGSVGELYIGGAGLAREYIGQAELTKEKFIQNPFTENTTARLYKTGDLVRWLPEDELEFIGRQDYQIKVRGFRIELGEIEHQLHQCRVVKDAAVLHLIELDDAHDSQIVAYLVADADYHGSVDDLRAFARGYLSASLPAYMVPEIFVILESMPLTPNGKIDRKQLPKPTGNDVSSLEYEAPLGDMEQTLCEFWQEVLGLEKVGVKDNFFHLGGHSLLATRLISMLRSTFRVDINLRALFEHPTIRSFSRYMTQLEGFEQLPVIKPVLDRTKLPLSFAQQRLWFIDKLSGSTQYNQPNMLGLSGKLCKKAMQQSMSTLIERHEVLRTTFVESGNEVVQVINQNADFVLQELDFTALTKAEQDKQLADLLANEGETPFDLQRDLMLRAKVITLAEEENVLLLTSHHVAFDGWSIGILTQELSALYSAFRDGKENPLPALPIQYADFAYWQRNWLQDEVLQQQMEFWDRYLEDLPQVHSLPLDKTRPAQQTFNGKSFLQTLDKSLMAQINHVCKQYDVTLFMFLQTSFSLLLGRFGNTQDVVIGTPIAGRTQQEVESLIGFFVNTLVLRTQLNSEQTFNSLLQSNKQNTLEAYNHQHVPFEMLVDKLQPERNASVSPLFQVMLALQNNEHGELIFDDLVLKPIEQEYDLSLFDLNLTAIETDEGLTINWSYNTDLFFRSSIERVSRCFETLLESIIRKPEANIYDFVYLSEADFSAAMLGTLSDNQIQKDDTLPVAFDRQVASQPENIAVQFGCEKLTYSELEQYSCELADTLGKYTSKGSVIGLSLPASVDLIAAMLAVAKSGFSYVLVAPRDLEVINQELPFDLLITSEKAAAIFTGCTALYIDEHQCKLLETGISDTAVQMQKLSTSDMQFGYLQSKQGSFTCHQLSQNNLSKMIDCVMLHKSDESDVVAQVSDISSPLFQLEVWSALASGAKLVQFPEDEQDSELTLQRFLNEHSVCLLCADVPFAAALLQNKTTDLSELKTLVLGRAEQGWQLHYVISDCQHPPSRLVFAEIENGASELSFLLVSDLEHASDENKNKSSWLSKIYDHHIVMDEHGGLTPVGAVGEICSITDTSNGQNGEKDFDISYQNHNQLTDSNVALVKHNILVRRLEQCWVDCVGAASNQTQFNGYPVNLSQIEKCLLQKANVEQAVVKVIENHDNEKKLVAYIKPMVTANTDSSIIEQCLKHSQQHLPRPILPAAYIISDVSLFDENGTLDDACLNKPSQEDYLDLSFTSPRTDMEHKLSDIWKEILRIEQVSVTANFFTLGGHSLSATRMTMRIKKAYDVDVPLQKLFEQPTIEAIARFITEIQQDSEEAIPAIQVQAVRSGLPLSFAQQRLWFIDKLASSVEYNQPHQLLIKGDFNKSAFEQAISMVVERHESLRTCFIGTEEVTQLILAAPKFQLEVINFSNEEVGSIDHKLKELAAIEASRPFDLSNDLMLRAKIVKLSEQEHVLLMTTHHIAFDGWSMGIFTHELSTLYSSFSNGEPSPLPPLELQYADFAKWQRDWLQGDVLKEQLSFWKTRLADLPTVHDLPLDFERPQVQSHVGDSVVHLLDKPLSDAVKDLCREHNVTLYMFLQSAFSILLGRYSNSTDIVMGTPIAGRTQPEVEPLIGFFVNTLVIRTDLTDNPTFSDLLAINKQCILDTYDNQHIPFEMLAQELMPERSTSHGPLFQIMLTVQNNDHGSFELEDLILQPLEQQQQSALCDLELMAVETPDGLALSWCYNTALFMPSTIENMVSSFELLIRGIVTAPDTPVQQLSITEPYSIERELAELSGECVHHVFEKQALRTPEKIAVEYENTSLTYEALNLQANCLAHYLIEKGVQPEHIIGLCMERSTDMLVAMLAILKSGGSYIPVDATLPQKRIDFLVKDSGLQFVVTHEDLQNKFTTVETLCVDNRETRSLLHGQATENPVVSGLTEHSLAYVIYTSGTTGTAKGVCVEHCNLYHYLQGAQQHYQLSEYDRVMQFASINFDASVEEIFCSLTQGSTLVLRNDSVLAGSEGFWSFIEVHNVNVVSLPTAFWHLLVSELTPAQISVAQHYLRLCIIGGEAVQASKVSKWQSQVQLPLLNTYGPTETTVVATVCDLTRPKTHLGMTPSIGQPLGHYDCLVMDGYMQQVPTGVIGELYVGGPAVARCYLNREELSAEKFIEHPFVADGRLYKTGDLVRYLHDGSLEYIGRIDSQVKVRGFRIELSEIEAVLDSHEQVQQSVVVAHDVNGDARLAAYVVLTGDGTDIEAQLRDHMATTLPEYMLPNSIMIIDALPLTSNGKVAHGHLPEPSFSFLQQSYVAPGNETEAQLCELWQQLLGVENIGIKDNFFLIGGHSLLVLKLHSMIKNIFGMQFKVMDLMGAETVEKQAKLLISGRNEHANESLTLLNKGDGTMPVYMIPGIGGHSSSFYNLTEKLGTQQTVYGFNSSGLDSVSQPHESVEEVANCYVQSLLKVHTKQPFILLGHSLGGVIAIEMIKILSRLDKEVPLLIILDGDTIMEPLDVDSQIKQLEMANVDGRYTLNYDGAKFTSREEELRSGIEGLEEVVVAQAKWNYSPCDVKIDDVLLIQPKESDRELAKNWQKLSSSKITLEKVEGDHYSILKPPHVNKVAEKITEFVSMKMLGHVNVNVNVNVFV
jgi:amino acid adenylation domain-containing protein